MTDIKDLNKEGKSELSEDEWIHLLSGDYPPSDEKIIIVSKLRKSGRLSMKKGQFRNYFSGFGGIGFAQGDEVEVVQRKDGGNKADLPDWVISRLALQPNDYVCLARRRGITYVKKLDFVERVSQIPGHIIVDKFSKTLVERRYSINTDLNSITYSYLSQLISKMGKFRYDPIAPFKEVEGRVGFLARKEFMGGFTKDDMEDIRDYKHGIIDSQLENGSWDNNTVRTSFNLIRLLEVGATIDVPAVKNAVKWLLSTTEPVGLPGLFMYSEDLIRRFNNWKKKPDAKGRPYRNATKSEIQEFYDNADILPNISGPPCALRMTWTSATAVEALLRCGLKDEKRVIRAINTLFSLSRMRRTPDGEWCGCAYLDAKLDFPEKSDPVDFNMPSALPQKNIRYAIDWFVTRKDIRKLVYGDGYEGLEIGPREALLIKRYKTTGECQLVMHRALSYHPKYHGSNLEAYAALRCAWRQNSYGTWGDAYLSSMFGFLERIVHPLSAFLVLRSVPLLIREQRDDGFWQDKPKKLADEHQWNAPPTKEQSTFMILKALQKFNFLQPLLPD